MYAGRLLVPADRPFLRLRGPGARPADVVLSDDRSNGTPRPGGGTWGTTGSASVTIDAADVSASDLTFANTFDEAAHPETETTNGYVTAASTDLDKPYGLLFAGCSLTSDAPPGAVRLGRPWHPSNDPNAIGQTVVRDSWLGAHIAAAPGSGAVAGAQLVEGHGEDEHHAQHGHLPE